MRRRRREPPRRLDGRTDRKRAGRRSCSRLNRFGAGARRAAGLVNVAFEVADLTSLDPGRTFDAFVGRLVLMYLPDPAATLAHLLKLVRPGGLVVFQEMEMSLARSVPQVRLYQACVEPIFETFRRAGCEIDMGSRLFSIYHQIGLPRPELRMEGRVEGGPGSGAYELTAETLRSLLPMMGCPGRGPAVRARCRHARRQARGRNLRQGCRDHAAAHDRSVGPDARRRKS